MFSSLKSPGTCLPRRSGQHWTVLQLFLILPDLDKQMRSPSNEGSWAPGCHRMAAAFLSGEGGFYKVALVTRAEQDLVEDVHFQAN